MVRSYAPVQYKFGRRRLATAQNIYGRFNKRHSVTITDTINSQVLSRTLGAEHIRAYEQESLHRDCGENLGCDRVGGL